jgi:plasmid stabilization system protein ParE
VNRRLVFLPAAKSDLAHAYDWYEESTPGRGEAFLFAFNACISTIERLPRIFSEVHAGARRALLRKFPYKIFYRIQEDVIVVLAVIHTARSVPRSWRI